MKKDIKNVLWGMLAGAAITIGAIIIAASILITNADIKESRRLTREIETRLSILDEYGSAAYSTYRDVEKEFEKSGDPGIGTYEFEYWGDTLRINATSTNGMCTISYPCR